MEDREDLIEQINRPLPITAIAAPEETAGNDSIDSTDHDRNEEDDIDDSNEEGFAAYEEDDDEDAPLELEAGLASAEEFFHVASNSGFDSGLNRTVPSSSTMRMSLERRQRILLGILFHRMMETQSRRRTRLYWEDDDASSSSESSTCASLEASGNVNRPPIRCISAAEAKEKNIVCRFCLDSTIQPAEGENGLSSSGRFQQISSILLAPCMCMGSSEYVHVECLRQWQLQTTKVAHATICSVCTTPYSLKPPKIRNDLVPAGSLLVFQDPNVTEGQSIFSKSVILMLRGGDAKTPMGVILNKFPTELDDEASTEDNDHSAIRKVRMRGGPVCGGRFGVVRQIVLHTVQTSTGEEEGQNKMRRKRRCLDGASAALSHRELFPNLQVIYDDETKEPAMLGQADFRSLHSQLQDALEDEAQTSTPSLTAESPHIFSFEGCCKWSKDQLKGELLRGSWGVCHLKSENDSSTADLAKTLQDLILWQVQESDDQTANSDSSGRSSLPTNDLWEQITTASPERDGNLSVPRLLSKSEWFRFPEEEEETLLRLSRNIAPSSEQNTT